MEEVGETTKEVVAWPIQSDLSQGLKVGRGRPEALRSPRGLKPILTLLMMFLSYLSLESLGAVLDAFSNRAKPLGLGVSWT